MSAEFTREGVRDIRERYARVSERVSAAADRVGRSNADVTIVAVTKRHPAEVVDMARAAGIVHVGENYAQELTRKLDTVQRADELEWHFIGHLQRNKAKYLVARTTLIHALDSWSAAEELNKRMARLGRDDHSERALDRQRVLVSVNLSDEPQKSGVRPGDLAGFLSDLDNLQHVECVGLMTMPPLADDPERTRPYFRRLIELRDQSRTPGRELSELSMGTTGDFEVAVEEGATLVRVGTAIFGPRAG